MIYSGSGYFWPNPEVTLGKKTLNWNVFCALSEQVVGIHGSVKIREIKIFWRTNFAVFRIRIHWVRIRIQHFRLNTDPNQDAIPIQGFVDYKMKKLTAENKFRFFLSKIAIYLSLDHHKGRLTYRRSLQSSKENIEHLKKWYFLNFLLFLWVIFALPDPDPLTSGSGSETHSGFLIR